LGRINLNLSNNNTIREFSAGGIVLDSISKNANVLLISRKKINPYFLNFSDKTEKTVWCLPKGKIEKSEDVKDAALREVREETGIIAKIIKKIDQIEYCYNKTKTTRCYKTVDFYMMKLDGGNISADSPEVEDVRWFRFDEAISLMSYDSEVDLVKKTRSELDQEI